MFESVFRLRPGRFFIAAASFMLVCGGGTALADHITTVDGQSLEGIIRDENRFYISLDVRGVIMPIPKDRIKEVTRATADDNVRSLMDRAQEARGRDDLVTARTLVDQAKAFNTTNTQLLDTLTRQDSDLSDLERRGGTQEARRAHAAILLQRANDAYDKVRVAEGNTLLLQALRTDPTYEDAQKRMRQLLGDTSAGSKTAGSELGAVDAETEAEYFANAVWPDHVSPDNPVLPRLAGAFKELASRFDQTMDMLKARRYVELMQIIYAAMQQHPEWKANAAPAEQALLNAPLPQLLSTMVANNLARGNAEFALQKLLAWANPASSPEIALLFARAQTATNRFNDASATLKKGTEAFPSDMRLQAHLNAANLLSEGATLARDGKTTSALDNFNKVFDAREQLVPEMGEGAGRQLADIRIKQLAGIETNAPIPSGYVIPDEASQVVRFSADQTQRRRAAEILAATMPRVPWRLMLSFSVNNMPITLEPALSETAKTALAKPFNVAFDDQSPFLLNLHVNFTVAATSATQALAAVAPGSSGLPAPVPASGLDFTVVAAHPSLGNMIQYRWAEADLPAEIKQALVAKFGESVLSAKPVFAGLQKASSISDFVALQLPVYMTQRIGLLNSRINLPEVKQLLATPELKQ